MLPCLHMNKISLRIAAIFMAVLVTVGLVGAGVYAANGVSRNTLRVTRTTFCVAENIVCDEPKGHVVLFSGWFDMRLLVTHADGLLNSKLMPLIQGKDIGRTGYYHAGIQDDLVFVRKGNTLQVQRETRQEMAAKPSVREPIFTMYLPASVKLEIAK